MYYLGWGSLALLGLIDASECCPTFGAGKRSARSSLGAKLHCHKENVFFFFLFRIATSDGNCVCVCVAQTMKTFEASSEEDTES